MDSTRPAGTTVITRSRKVHPRLKERAEKFLSNATVPQEESSFLSTARQSRKRNRHDETSEEHLTPSKRRATSERNTKLPLHDPKASRKASRVGSSASREAGKTAWTAESTTAKPKKHPSSPKSSAKSLKSEAFNEPDKSNESDEKRLKRFRSHAPQSYLQKLNRAQTQRMIVLKRSRVDTEAFPKEDIELVGSTGNVYTVSIGQIPSCTCPDHQKGNECKHKVYVLHNVLKAPEHLQYQLAYLSSELRDIFASAPPIPTDVSSSEDTAGKRRLVEGECPICYMDFDEAHNQLVWCRAACGNNMHKACFDQWAASQRGGAVKCVYCRTPWQMEPGDIDQVKKAGSIGVDGYVNIGEHYGISQERDYSTYHPSWVRRHLGAGW